MSTVKESIKHLKSYPPDQHVAVVIWSPEDVQTTADEMLVTLTPEEIDEILDKLENKHDAELGISWLTIQVAIEDLKSPKHSI